MAPSIIVGVGVLASHQCFMSEKENLTTSWGRIFCSEILEGSLSCVPCRRCQVGNLSHL